MGPGKKRVEKAVGAGSSPPKIGGRNAKPAVTARRSGRRSGRRRRLSAAEVTLARLAEAKRIRREERGMFIAEVARASGIAPQSILQFERQTRPMLFTTLHAIAAALDRELVWKLELREEA